MAEQQFFFGVHGVIADRGRLLILRRAAAMTYQPGAWDLPGGHLALGEDFVECLQREVDEETGLRVEIGRLVGMHKAIAEPYIQAIYACTPIGFADRIRLRANEHDDSRWVTPAELRRASPLIPYLAAISARGMLDYLSAD
jgi:8-oxo-dGTP pyrophosphatase MutT (NUDIX family)